MSEWQPIETAPRDGERVLVAWKVTSGFEIHVGYWSGDWREAYAHAILDELESPTQWMPISQPPAEGRDNG